jgi:transposase
VLDAHHFDAFVEDRCAPSYDDGTRGGRPGLAPGVYFRCLLVGYFEGIGSERGIDWRCNDSLSLKAFLGVAVDAPAPDHSTISRTRRLIDLETHAQVFQFLLKVLANHGLVEGRTAGVDSTTLEANAAMRGIVRRDTGESYQEFLARLAKESGIETPTRDDLAKLDRKRKNKAGNDDWQSPGDPDATVTKMKDGTTHLAHKAEHAVDLGGGGHGAILAVNVCDAAAGDTATLTDTVVAATENLRAVSDDDRVADKIGDDSMSEAVIDKGYHSRQTLLDLDGMGVRSYASEPARGRQNWDGQRAARDAVYANRRRVKGERGRRPLRSRGGEAGTHVRPLLRDRRDAAAAPARPRERGQAGADPRGGIQRRADDARRVRPAEAAGPLRHGGGGGGGPRAVFRAGGPGPVDPAALAAPGATLSVMSAARVLPRRSSSLSIAA